MINYSPGQRNKDLFAAETFNVDAYVCHRERKKGEVWRQRGTVWQTQRRLNSLNTSKTIANTGLAISAFPSPMLYYLPRPFYCDLLLRKWQHALNIDWNVYTFNTVPRKLFNHVSTFSVFFFFSFSSFFTLVKLTRVVMLKWCHIKPNCRCVVVFLIRDFGLWREWGKISHFVLKAEDK